MGNSFLSNKDNEVYPARLKAEYFSPINPVSLQSKYTWNNVVFKEGPRKQTRWF